MPNTREKLIELLDMWQQYATEEEHVDYLIANGVTVQEWVSVKDRLPEDDLPKDTKKKMIRCLIYE